MRTTNDRGAAMILALMATLLLAGLGLCLTLVGDTEQRIAYNFEKGEELSYAVDAAIERAAADLAQTPSWDLVLAGGIRCSFADATRRPVGPSGAILDLDALTAELQASTNGAAFGANTPVWRLYAWGPLTAMAATSTGGGPYLAVWVADDLSEVDGDAADDSNSTVMIHAAAFGPANARRSGDAHVRRSSAGVAVFARRYS